MDMLGPETRLLEQLMSAASLRHKVLAHNVSNQNTPGFKRQYVQFEELLRQTLEAGGDPARVAPRIVTDEVTPARPDGNNVTLELEESSQDENVLLFEAYAAILHNRFELLRASIDGGSR
jgi:flagellar basal-body rod protein FlgB